KALYLRNLGRCARAPRLALRRSRQGMAAVSQLSYVYLDVVPRHLQGRQGGLPLCRISTPFVVGACVLLFKVTKRALRFLRRRSLAGRGSRQPWTQQGGGYLEIGSRAGTLVIPQGQLRLRRHRGDSV